MTFAQESDRNFAPATRFLPPATRDFAHPSTTQQNLKMSANNNGGAYGEYVAQQLLLRRYHGDSYFSIAFLGDKYPTVDLLVELVNPPANIGFTPYFFAQIKTSHQPQLAPGGRLRARITAPGITRLIGYPAPTYIIGIHATPYPPAGYIFAATIGGPPTISSIPTSHPLTVEQTLIDLYHEVLTFWQGNPVHFNHSMFV